MPIELIDVLRIIVAAVQLIVAAIVGFAAVNFYRWQKDTKKKDEYVGAIYNYHNLNLLVIQNSELQDIETENHFVSSSLSRKDVRKMFYYFEQLNSIGGVLEYTEEGLKIPESDGGIYYVSTVKNIIKCTYWDRRFIQDHCFPRGYTDDFIEFMNSGWNEAESELRDMGYLQWGKRPVT